MLDVAHSTKKAVIYNFSLDVIICQLVKLREGPVGCYSIKYFLLTFDLDSAQAGPARRPAPGFRWRSLLLAS